jgi:antitoxin VapB
MWGRAVPLREELAVIRERCSRLPVLDDRPADEIIGYDDKGVPR